MIKSFAFPYELFAAPLRFQPTNSDWLLPSLSVAQLDDFFYPRPSDLLHHGSIFSLERHVIVARDVSLDGWTIRPLRWSIALDIKQTIFSKVDSLTRRRKSNDEINPLGLR